MQKRLLFVVIALFLSVSILGSATSAADITALKAQGAIRHLTIPYANFVTGAGDGMDVELVKLFAARVGVKYEVVAADWGTIIPDLIGAKIKVSGAQVERLDPTPFRGDIIANGFTILPWRQQAVNFSIPTFPSQIWLIARADSPVRPIKPGDTIEQDIAMTKSLMKGQTVFSMKKTCLDPALYDLAATGAKVVCRTGNLNEMAPAVLNKEGDMTILDVPDALIALEKWKGKLKIIGPVSAQQYMAAAFAKDSPELLNEYNAFLGEVQHNGVYLALIQKYYPSAIFYFPEFFEGMN